MIRHLTFHGVGPAPRALEPGEAKVWLTTEQFCAILDAVAHRPDVRLSFDDSNRSDVDVALPELVARGLTATFFVLAGRLDDPGHLGRDDLATLRDAGMAVGSHGLDHRNWRTLGDDELAAEVAGSQRVLADACPGAPIAATSIPFGAYDRRVLRAVRAAYEKAYTSDGGAARASGWLVPRTSATVDDTPATLLAGEPVVAVAARSARKAVKRWR